MILVVLAVLVATAAGIVCERRYAGAPRLAALILRVMLYALVPFVSYVSIAHLHITVGAGVGLALAWVTVLTLGAVTYRLGRRWRLGNGELGALICTVVVANTGNLGLPMVVALLGGRDLGQGVAYDQLVNNPSLLIIGFGVGAALGERSTGGFRTRARSFFTKNPPLLAVVAGLLASPALAPAPLPALSHVAVGVLLVLGFFTVGISLAAEREQEAAPLVQRPDRRVALSIGLRLALAPLILGGLSLIVVRVPATYLLEAAMPSGINSLLVSHAYGLDQRLIAGCIIWSTAIALIAGLVLAAL